MNQIRRFMTLRVTPDFNLFWTQNRVPWQILHALHPEGLDAPIFLLFLSSSLTGLAVSGEPILISWPRNRYLSRLVSKSFQLMIAWRSFSHEISSFNGVWDFCHSSTSQNQWISCYDHCTRNRSLHFGCAVNLGFPNHLNSDFIFINFRYIFCYCRRWGQSGWLDSNEVYESE